MKTQSTESERTHVEYFRNLRRFARWLQRWRQTTQSTDAIMHQVLEGESLARARAWGAPK